MDIITSNLINVRSGIRAYGWEKIQKWINVWRGTIIQDPRVAISHFFLLLFSFLFFRYGYIDPQDNVREFTYKSGNPCDPETKQPLVPDPTPEAEQSKNGYFDYSDNRFVLPSGKRVTVVVNKKNRARG